MHTCMQIHSKFKYRRSLIRRPMHASFCRNGTLVDSDERNAAARMRLVCRQWDAMVCDSVRILKWDAEEHDLTSCGDSISTGGRSFFSRPGGLYQMLLEEVDATAAPFVSQLYLLPRLSILELKHRNTSR